MRYEISRLLAYQSYQDWISTELFSLGWFITIGLLTTIYAIWLKLVDKSRLRDIVLLGLLSVMGFVITELVLIGYLGVAEYKIRLFPFEPNLFIVSVTKAPILYMLILQYTASWRKYLLWAGIGTAVISFGLFPLYSLLGIYQLHKWNYVYQFLLMLTDGVIARALLLWITSLELSQSSSSRICEIFPVIQPAATKPLNEDPNEDPYKDQ
jgi:hypothetical protein